MQIVAEVKTHSPFGWKSPNNWRELFDIANEVGDIISIHTDPRWHGSFDLIAKARQLTNKPILAKGIHANDSEIVDALNAGADFVLVVGRIPSIHLDMCFIEPNTIGELAALDPRLKAVWNSRDLSSGGMKEETFSQARDVFAGWLCQASNIELISDINMTSDAILVGEHLPEIADDLRKYKLTNPTFKQ